MQGLVRNPRSVSTSTTGPAVPRTGRGKGQPRPVTPESTKRLAVVVAAAYERFLRAAAQLSSAESAAAELALPSNLYAETRAVLSAMRGAK